MNHLLFFSFLFLGKEIKNVFSKTRREGSSILRGAGAANHVKKDVFVARDAEFGCSGEIILVLSLIQQCLEEWVLQQTNFNNKPPVIFTHIHYQVTLWNISWNGGVSLVHGRPQCPLAAGITPSWWYHSAPHSSPLLQACPQELPPHHLRLQQGIDDGEERRMRDGMTSWKWDICIYRCGKGEEKEALFGSNINGWKWWCSLEMMIHVLRVWCYFIYLFILNSQLLGFPILHPWYEICTNMSPRFQSFINYYKYGIAKLQ